MYWAVRTTWYLLTPPGIEVMDGRELGPGDVLGRTHHLVSSDTTLCKRLAVGCQAVAVPSCDVASQDALNGAHRRCEWEHACLFPVVHDQLQYLVVLATHCQVCDLLPVGCLIVVMLSEKLNDGVSVYGTMVLSCTHCKAFSHR
jgi:hypothetical protein